MIKRFILMSLLFLSFSSQANDKVLNRIENLITAAENYADKNTIDSLSDNLINNLKGYDNKLQQLRAAESFLEPESNQAALNLIHQRLRNLLSQVDPGLTPLNLDQQTNSLEGASGIIRGRLISEDSFTNTRVGLYDINGTLLYFKNLDNANRYIFNDLAAGSYFIYLEHNTYYSRDYVSQFNGGIICPNGLGVGCSLNDLIPIQLASGDDVSGIDFQPIRKATIKGILDIDLNVQNYLGNVTLYDSNENYVTLTSIQDDGSYELVAPEPGQYYVRFNANGYQSELFDGIACEQYYCDFTNAQAITVGNIGVIELPDVSLSSYQKITGTTKEYQTLDLIEGGSNILLIDADTSQLYDSVYFDVGAASNGIWTINKVPPGNYYLSTSADDYIAQMYSFQNCETGNIYSCDIDALNPTVVQHNINAASQNIHFRLFAGGSISGLVKDESGSPASYADVRLYNEEGQYIYSQSTNYDGSFKFNNLSNGIYYLSGSDYSSLLTLHFNRVCSNQSYNSICNSATEGTPIVLSNLAHLENKNIILKSGSQVTGRVTDNQGNPISNARVNLFKPLDYPQYSSYSDRTDSNGVFEMNAVRANNYYMVVYREDYQAEIYNNKPCPTYSNCPTGSAQLLNIDGNSNYNGYQISLESNPEITVNLNNLGNPVSDGFVQFYNSNGDFIDSSYVYDSKVTATLPAGSYYIRYISNSYYLSKVYGYGNCFDNECNPESGVLQHFNINNNYTININIDKRFVLSGTITDINQSTINTSSKTITFYQNNQIVYSYSFYGSDGTYEVHPPITGFTKIEVHANGYYRHFYNNINCINTGCGLGGATGIAININQQRTLNFNLKPIGEISGWVRNYQGEPLVNYNVELLNRYGSRISTHSTDENGRYHFTGIQQGDHYILARGNNLYESTFNGNISCGNYCNTDGVNPINIAPGTNATSNISLKKKAQLSFSDIKYINGEIANNVTVKLKNIDDNYWTTSYYTDNAGNIEDIGLVPGNYIIIARKSNSYNGPYTYYNEVVCLQEWLQVCEDQATVITVGYGTQQNISDFKIHSKGSITVNLTDDETADSVNYASINVYDESYSFVGNYSTSSTGIANIDGLTAGSYYIYVNTNNSNHYPEVYDDVICPLGLGVSCLITEGTPVYVEDNTNVVIDIGLKKKSSLKVNLVDSLYGTPLDGYVRIFSSTGESIGYNHNTSYEIYLDPGFYYILGTHYYSGTFNVKAYPDVICSDYDEVSNCETTPQLIEIGSSLEDIEINLYLDYISGFQGVVLDKETKQPVEGVILDFWNIDTDSHAFLAETDSNGNYRVYNYSSNNFKLSTDVPSGLNYYNQVYNSRTCPDGPVIAGLCDLDRGVVLPMSNENSPNQFDIYLYDDDIFMSDFN